MGQPYHTAEFKENEKNSFTPDSPSSPNFPTSYIRAIHNAVNPYTQVRNETVRDSSLSFGALGLLTYIFSHADSWKIFPRTLWKNRKEGLRKIYTLFNELIEAGYACRMSYREKLNNGKFGKQMFGYAFFEVKATQEDIDNVQEEFKKFYRNYTFCNHGICDDAKRNIKKEQVPKKKQRKETTTGDPPTPSKSPPPCQPAPSATALLSFFDRHKKALQGLDPDSVEKVRALFETASQRTKIDNPKGWVTQCVKEKWYLKAQENEPSQRREVNRKKAQEFEKANPKYVRLMGDNLSFNSGRVTYGINVASDSFEFDKTLENWMRKIEEIDQEGHLLGLY